MLMCFTAGWYWSIVAMLRTGEPRGKSFPFVAFTVIGYLLGLGAKLYSWNLGYELSHVALLYTWNLAITMIDLILVVHFTRTNRRRLSGASPCNGEVQTVD